MEDADKKLIRQSFIDMALNPDNVECLDCIHDFKYLNNCSRTIKKKCFRYIQYEHNNQEK